MCRLRRHPCSFLNLSPILDLPHEIHTVGNDDENDPHVLSKRQEQVTEVLRLNRRILRIQLIHAQDAVDDVCHLLAKLTLHFLHANHPFRHTIVHQDADDGSAVQSNLLCRDDCRLQVEQDGVHSKLVTMQLSGLGSPQQNSFHLAKVIRIQHISHQPLQPFHGFQQQFTLIFPQSSQIIHACHSKYLHFECEVTIK